jgi:hypothetical protein
MAKMQGFREQGVHDYGFRSDGSIASGTAPQLILPEHSSRSSLLLQNTSAESMWVEFGGARATASLSGTAVSGFTITNPGFNYTLPPTVDLLGGGGQAPSVGGTGPNYPSPQASYGANFRPAKAHAVLTGGAVSSIVIDDPGLGYLSAPFVLMRNRVIDPNGCADPSNGGGSGMLLQPFQWLHEVGLVMVTDPIAVFCATVGATFFCRFTT